MDSEEAVKNISWEGITNVPPQAIESERAVLGALMQAGDNEEPYFDIQSEISANSFYQKKHKLIFTACSSLASRQEPIDLISVTAELEKSKDLEAVGGVPYLDELIDSCPTTVNIKFYAGKVREAAIRRYLIKQCALISLMADDPGNDIDDVIDQTEAAIMTIRDNKTNSHLVDSKTAMLYTVDRIKELCARGDSIIGLPSGFRMLDLKLSGMQSGQYIIVAGRPGMGKSVFIQNIIKNVAVDQNKGVMLFSVETSWEAFSLRLTAQVSGQDFQALRTGHVGNWSAFAEATSRIREAPLWIDSSGGIKPSGMRGTLRQIQRETPIALIAVDYMQLMKSDERQEGRRLEIESISAGLKALGQEFRCPILVCSQLSRKCEERPDKRPLLSDLRESGAIEQDADVVLAVYRHGKYNNKIDPKHTELLILKHRDGPVGKIHMEFNMGIMEFTEVNQELSRVSKDEALAESQEEGIQAGGPSLPGMRQG